MKTVKTVKTVKVNYNIYIKFKDVNDYVKFVTRNIPHYEVYTLRK